MAQIHRQIVASPIGELVIGSYDHQLCLLDYRYRKMRDSIDQRLQTGLQADFVEQDDELLQNTREQLDEYFAGERRAFELPLLTVGTDFQKSVWQALQQIAYGETASYLELAKTIGNEKAVRAVANANGANAIALVIPCHRIIGSNGQLVGYAGGLPAKEKLLRLEGASQNASLF